MQNRAQVEAQLRQETRDAIFNRQLSEAIDRRRQDMIDNAGKTYSEQVDSNRYTTERPTWGQNPEMF